MWAVGIASSSFLLLYILKIADGVILRPFRYNQSITASTAAPSWNLTTSGTTHVIVNASRYVASEHGCCAVGQRVARKSMPCDITNLAVLRKWHNFSNPPSKRLKRKDKLSGKISVCSALYPKDMVLCCKHKDYHKQKKKCQKKPRKQREKCRQLMKKRFS